MTANAAAFAPAGQPETEPLSTTFDATYTWNYGVARQDLRNLYEKAKREQWNASEQLAWSTDVDPEAEHIPDIQIPIYGTLWALLLAYILPAPVMMLAANRRS